MAALHQQIVLVATRTSSTLTAWYLSTLQVFPICNQAKYPISDDPTTTACRDVQTGTHLSSFKDNASGPNALALLGRDYLVSAQHPKGSLHFWAWHKVLGCSQIHSLMLQPCPLSSPLKKRQISV